MVDTRPLSYRDIVTPDELREAVASAGRYGGSIADHLLRFGYAGRVELLQVLSYMSGCPDIDLRTAEVDSTALGKLPASEAWRLKVIPLAYDEQSGCLTLACANPKDPSLKAELDSLLPGSDIKYCVALETDLKCSLLTYYRESCVGGESSDSRESEDFDDSLSDQMLTASASTGKAPVPAIDLEESLWSLSESTLPTRVLILAPEGAMVKYLAQSLRHDNCAVRIVSDPQVGLQYCEKLRFTHVFIHSNFSDLAVDLLLQLRDRAPRANVRFFTGISEFVLVDEHEAEPQTIPAGGGFGKTMPIPIGEANSRSRLLLHAPVGAESSRLKHKLETNLFVVHQSETIQDCAKHFKREGADIVLLCRHGNADEVAAMIGELAANGYVMDRVPTYILTDFTTVANLNWLLTRGVEDIVPIDPEWQSLVIKLNRMRSRLEKEKGERIQTLHDMGTHGTLKDMNVIDLLQAMGPGDKTVRISVTGSGKHLTMFLDHGKLTYAACDDKYGAEAVYDGLTWKAGIWSVDPISRDDLPEPNNDRSIDSILIEGCHLLDRLGQSEFNTLR